MNSIHLSGSDDVRQAGGRISDAAQEMRRAAESFDFSVSRLGQMLDRFETAIASLVEVLERRSPRT